MTEESRISKEQRKQKEKGGSKMSVFGWIFVIGFLSSIYFRFGLIKKEQGKYMFGWAWRFIVFTLFTWWVLSVVQVPMTGPFGGALKLLIFWWVVNIMITLIEQSTTNEFDNTTWIGVSITGLAILVSIFHLTAYRVINIDKTKSLVEVKASKDFLEQTDTKHIRLVPKETAKWIGDKIIGEGGKNYGSIYKPGDYSIQRVGNELYWVAPLEFGGFFERRRANGISPGFIMVFWTNHLARYVYYHGYNNVCLLDYNFEVTDNLKPYWVVSMVMPTVGYGSEKVLGVLVVDPETGEIKEYRLGKDELPAWVDRVIPERIAFSYNTWWGKYVHGWWQGNVGQMDVHLPTSFGGSQDEDLWLTYGKDGMPYWFTGHTSPKLTDKSLVGYTMMGTRTGELFYFELTGPTEDAVVSAVKTTFSEHPDWYVTQPILYRIYGELTWVVPVINDNGIYQKVAIVHAVTAKVVYGDNKEDALQKYRQYLATSGDQVAPVEDVEKASVSGTVIRIHSVGTTSYLLIDTKPKQVFAGDINLLPELALTEKGDKVNIKFIETTEPFTPLAEFDNMAIELQKSANQEKFESIHEEQTKIEKENWGKQKELEKELNKLRSK
ncbi:hypothetical protein HYT26_04025 [Candidatus Pacearchaeota archaeon]|nr:hypothetical protein [Candidatus Pacearchaeota archaeon]